MRKSFTMVELIVVMVIIGVIAAFAIPNFTKTINRSKARDGILNLNLIHASNVLYRSRNGGNLTAANITAINVALGLNIIDNGATYVCNGTNGTCVAAAGECAACGTGFKGTATLASPLCPAVTASCPTLNPVCAGASCP